MCNGVLPIQLVYNYRLFYIGLKGVGLLRIQSDTAYAYLTYWPLLNLKMRLTEFIEYINSRIIDRERVDNYSHLTVDEKIKKFRKKYLKERRNDA